MPRPYTGTRDGLATGTRPGTKELARLTAKRFRTKNLGMWTNRTIHGTTKLSVHATGRAVDLGYKRRSDALALWNFLIANTAELGIEEIHDYAYKWPNQDPKDKTAWGAGYRCSRGEGMAGIKIFTATDNAGSPGGRWLHVCLSPAMADNPKLFRQAWIAALRRSGLV